METVLITASPAVLAERLAARGRETVAEIHARLARRVEDRPEDYDLVIVMKARWRKRRRACSPSSAVPEHRTENRHKAR